MRLLLFFVLVAALASCKQKDPLEVVLPKDYLPAYPGSYWYYSNGELSSVHTSYVAHSYQPSINSPGYTGEKLVPYIDQKYLYGYSITQNSTTYPLKLLISEKIGDSWVVNDVNGQKIRRKSLQSIDSLKIKLTFAETKYDTVFTEIIEVVEYTDSLNSSRWNTKEYYAKNVGLIQVEVNNPFDTVAPIIQKQIIKYKINN